MRTNSSLGRKAIVLDCLEVLNSQLADSLSKAALDKIAEDNLHCAEFTDTKRTRILENLLLSASEERLSSEEEFEETNFAKSLLHSAVNFLSSKKLSIPSSSGEHVSNISNTGGNLEEMARTFPQLGKYDEKSGPIENFIRDFEDLLIVDNITADQVKKAALRSLLPYTVRDYLENNSDDTSTYQDIKRTLIEKYDGSTARRIAYDKTRYFKLKYSETELESSINALGKLVKESLDSTDEDEILRRQLYRLKEKLEDNYELFVHFRSREDRYSTLAEAASDLQIVFNDNIRLSRIHRRDKVKMKESKRYDLYCKGCFNKGHKISDCRSKNVECRKCHGKGHYSNKCPTSSDSLSTHSSNKLCVTSTSTSVSPVTNPWEALKNCMLRSSENNQPVEIDVYSGLTVKQSRGNSDVDTVVKKNSDICSDRAVNESVDDWDNRKSSKRVTSNSCDMYVKVEFEDGFIAPGIVDSGCQKSAVSLSRANKLGFNSKKAKSERIYMANGSFMISYGTYRTTLKFDNVFVKTDCCVLADKCFSDFKHHLFVGTDVLKATCSIIDFEKNTLRMCNRYVSLIVKCSAVKKTTFLVADSAQSCDINIDSIEMIKSEFSDRFSKNKYDIGACTIVCPTLLVSTEDPPKIRRYPIPEGKRSLVLETIKLWEENKICIRDENVTWLMNMVLVPKRDNQDRICLDSRPLNSVLIGDSYTTPTLADIRCKLVNGKYFTTLDLTQSFLQIVLDDSSSKKLGFKSPNGLTYRFLRMPFGLKIATSVFQRTIDRVLYGLDFALSYVDDILVVTKTTISDHFVHIQLVLDRLRKFDLKVNYAKSQWCGTSVVYLGHAFSADGQRPCDSNAAAIVNYPAPKSLKSLRRYLGKIGYFRNNIPKLASLQKPLTDLLRNKSDKSPFYWTEEAETAFLKTKEALVKAVTISYPNFNLPFKLYCDASSDCFASVLMQNLSKDIDSPLGFFSKRNPDRKKFIPATYLEIRCIAESLDYFRQYVYGNETHIYTDHMSIIKICENNTDRNLFRYVERILEYNVVIHYIRGKENIPADALSRAHLLRTMSKVDDNDGIVGTESKDNIIKNIANVDCLKLPKISDSDKLKYMKSVHDDLGHMCYERCYPLLVARYKWPGMSLDFRKHIQSCNVCLSRNNPKKRPYHFEHTSANFPFEKVNVDVCGPFRATSRGNKYFIGLIDVLTKYIILQEIVDADSEALINFFNNKVIFLYSCPIDVKLDNAQYCKARKLIKFFEDLNIKYSYSTPLHHEGNCNIERVFKTIHTLISKELKINPDLEWDMCLNKIAFFYNATVHMTTKFSPFYLIFGRNPVLKSDVILDANKLKYLVDYDLNDVLDKCHLQAAHNIAKELSDITRERLNAGSCKNVANADSNSYNIGDKVLIRRPNLKNERKHDCPWQTGYEITDVYKNYVECRVRNPKTNGFKGRPRKVFFTDVKLDTSS
uniref:RNA-directed DNA polymerase n=1 Tax=Strongyloides venezuelensis TaxID=75913 RepID=A0A0K0FET0_STRVS